MEACLDTQFWNLIRSGERAGKIYYRLGQAGASLYIVLIMIILKYTRSKLWIPIESL